MFIYHRPTHLPTNESMHVISVILWMSFTDKYLQIWSRKTCLWVSGSRCSSLSGKVLQQHRNQTVIYVTNLNCWFLMRDIIKPLQFVVTHLNNKINSTVFHIHTKVQGTKKNNFQVCHSGKLLLWSTSPKVDILCNSVIKFVPKRLCLTYKWSTELADHIANPLALSVFWTQLSLYTEKAKIFTVERANKQSTPSFTRFCGCHGCLPFSQNIQKFGWKSNGTVTVKKKKKK